MVFALYNSAFAFVFGQDWDDQVNYVIFHCIFFFYGFPVFVGIWRRAGCGSTVLSQLPLRHKLSPVGNQACHNAKNNCHQLPSLAVETSFFLFYCSYRLVIFIKLEFSAIGRMFERRNIFRSGQLCYLWPIRQL